MLQWTVKLKRLSDQRWQWIVFDRTEVLASGEAAGEAFAFFRAAKAIAERYNYQDEIGLLRRN